MFVRLGLISLVPSYDVLEQHTVSMTMMFHSNTKYLESMHTHRCALHSSLALQDQIDCSREQIDKRVSVRSRSEHANQTQLQNLAHHI